MAGRVPIELTVKDLHHFRDRLQVGQKVVFTQEEPEEGRITRKRRIKEHIAEKYPHHALVEYRQNGRRVKQSIMYIDLYQSMKRREAAG